MTQRKRRPEILVRNDGDVPVLEMSAEAVAQLPDVDENTSPYSTKRALRTPYGPVGEVQRIPEACREDMEALKVTKSGSSTKGDS